MQIQLIITKQKHWKKVSHIWENLLLIDFQCKLLWTSFKFIFHTSTLYNTKCERPHGLLEGPHQFCIKISCKIFNTTHKLPAVYQKLYWSNTYGWNHCELCFIKISKLKYWSHTNAADNIVNHLKHINAGAIFSYYLVSFIESLLLRKIAFPKFTTTYG